MRLDKQGFTWDTIPLLEELAEWQGRPGGVLGLEYAYVPLDLIREMTSDEPPTHNPYSGEPLSDTRPRDGGQSERDQWRWVQAAPQIFACIDGDKKVEWQILRRGVPVDAGPAWYRVRTYVHPALLLRMGWDKRDDELLGTTPPAMKQQPQVAAFPTKPAPAQPSAAR